MMHAITGMRATDRWARSVLVMLLLVAASGCGPATPEPVDTAHLIGRWEMQSDGETEWVDISADGSFSATIRQEGFLATTLSQSQPVSLSGTWLLDGNVLGFRITTSTDDSLVGQARDYEIEELTDRSMVTLDGDEQRKTLRKGL